MTSSPTEQPGRSTGTPVPMSRLLSSCAAAAAVCTPPAPADQAPDDQGSTRTRVPIPAKSQSA
ncbi:hypothetical protein E6W39_25905 [Kitasatospora acidiphila]|uniref:Uncharacterized protein n=1 Tax=Kitasatospora acidiphila TaxID=2567942 RepID=A0A540W7S0_9ACTN|nr:hypothetical protein E6W39_25905 [Kitasatospora acidiphila]